MRAFAQIVGAGLERQSDHADAPLAAGRHLADRQFDVLPIRREDARVQRQFDVLLLGKVQRRTQVLGQAGAAERKPRLQVGARDVELRVPAQQVHHFERIGAQRLAQARGFVGERDLQRVEVVAAVLDRLRRAHRGHVEVAGQMSEQAPQHLRGVIAVGADDGERRMVVVADRRSLAQELRLEADVEVLAFALAGGFLHQRAQHALHRARHEGRAEHERMHVVDAGQRCAQFPRQPQHRRLILAAVGGRRRADADQRDLAAAQRLAPDRW